MDPHAILTSQGWRGSGHSLHPTSDQTGLSRPILVSRKQNNLGVGKKQHRTSDMWWMDAFDKSLKGLDTTNQGKVVQTLTNGGLDMVAYGGSKFVGNGGLYASFVRGESLSGTITPEDGELPPSASRLDRSNIDRETKEERRARRVAKRVLPATDVSPCVGVPEVVTLYDGKEDNLEAVETKEQRRERRKQKKLQLVREAEVAKNTIARPAMKKKRRRKDKR